MTAEHFLTTTVSSVYICMDRVCKQEARSRSLKMFRYNDLCRIRIPSFNEGSVLFLSPFLPVEACSCRLARTIRVFAPCRARLFPIVT